MKNEFNSDGVDFDETAADDSSVQDAEIEARNYAERKNAGKNYRSDIGETNEEKAVAESAIEWAKRKRKI